MFFSDEPETPVPFPANAGVDGVRGYCFSRVANFRDLGGFSIPRTNLVTKDGMIFRSAAPTYATDADKEILFVHLDIVTLVDLRTSFETKNLNFGRPKLEDNFITYCIKTQDGCGLGHTDHNKECFVMEQQPSFSLLKRLYKGTPRLGERRMSLCGIERKRYSVPLINNHYFFNGVYPQAPLAIKMRCSVVSLMINENLAAYFLLRYLNELGLFEMYRLTVEHTKREILTIFRIFSKPDNYPLMFFCSLGKDRTGIITALLLSSLGVDRTHIIDNFHLSEKCLKPNIDGIKRYFIRIGLSKDEFVRAPKMVLKQLLEYLDRNYGSVRGYLHAIGFTYNEQQYLFDLLTCEKKLATTAYSS